MNKTPNQSSSTSYPEDSFWCFLENAIREFELAENGGRTIDLELLLPSPGISYRTRVLVALIKLDIEAQWKRERHVKTEDYLKDWEELTESEQPVFEILESECRTRFAHHDVPTLDELTSRFPNFAERLESWFFKIHSDKRSQDSLVGSFLTSQGIGNGESKIKTGQLLGRYRIDSVIGRGGMGTVYLARDTKLERQVAIKVLHPKFGFATEDTNLLLNEARLVAKLSHRSIVPVFDVGTNADGSLFFVMEYVPGVTLDELIKQRSITRDSAIEISIHISQALAYAHSMGVAHRDIKPANIIIDESGNARITDFGLALHSDDRKHCLGEISGTLPYMSPEQLTGDTNASPKHSDIWAAGVVLFEMLTGARPFAGKTNSEIIANIETAEFDRPSQLSSTSTKQLDEICRKCLSRSSKNRYTTADELAEDLRKSQATPKWNRLAVSAGFVLLLIAMVIWWNRDRPFVPPLQSELASIETCPDLAGCNLVLVMHTGAEINIDDARDYIASNSYKLLPDEFFSFDASQNRDVLSSLKKSQEWLSWEMPIAFNEHKLRTNNSWLIPSELTLSIRFAVNSNGVFQIGTVSKLPQEELLTLVFFRGLYNYSNFDGSQLDIQRPFCCNPASPNLQLGRRHTVLAHWLSCVYSGMNSHRESFSKGGPDNGMELYRCPFEMRNLFGQPVSVVMGRIHHFQFEKDHLQCQLDEYKRNNSQFVQLLDLLMNDRWSPVSPELPDQDVKIEYHVHLDYRQATHSAIQFVASVDDDTSQGIRNTSSFVATGMDRGIPPWNEDANSYISHCKYPNEIDLDSFLSATSDRPFEESSFVKEDFGNGCITGADRKVSGARAIQYNKFPAYIGLKAFSRYSVVKPGFRLAVIGEVEILESHSTAIPLIDHTNSSEVAVREIQPEIWVIPPYEK